jgi:DNA-binding NtrC family response regulator
VAHRAMVTRRTNEISTTGNWAGGEYIEAAPLLESQNPAMIALRETAKSAAAANTTSLLTGERGTGKDVLA